MASSKPDVTYIASEIAKANISHHVLTSEVDTEEQEAIAEDWQNSRFSILISSSIAIVSNENPKCHHLVMSGYLFNIITIVQAINCLHPKQRWGGASIRVFLPNYPEQYFDDLWEKKRNLLLTHCRGRDLYPEMKICGRNLDP
jgi:hypothetical protein